MNILHLVGWITIGATIVSVLLAVLGMAIGRNQKYQQPGRYTLGQEWTREPLLFSAVDEAPVAAHGAHHDDHGTASLIGGAARGKW